MIATQTIHLDLDYTVIHFRVQIERKHSFIVGL